MAFFKIGVFDIFFKFYLGQIAPVVTPCELILYIIVSNLALNKTYLAQVMPTFSEGSSLLFCRNRQKSQKSVHGKHKNLKIDGNFLKFHYFQKKKISHFIVIHTL